MNLLLWGVIFAMLVIAILALIGVVSTVLFKEYQSQME